MMIPEGWVFLMSEVPLYHLPEWERMSLLATQGISARGGLVLDSRGVLGQEGGYLGSKGISGRKVMRTPMEIHFSISCTST